MVNGLVTEIADQAAGKAWQTGDFRCFITFVEGFDKVQRIAFVLFDDFALMVNIDMAAAGFEIGLAGQADKGIAAETLTTHYRFEQITERLVGQFEIKRERGIQIRQ